VAGVPLSSIPVLNRPVPVSLDDARKVADDFILLRTTRSSAERFFHMFDFGPLRQQCDVGYMTGSVLIVRDAAGLAIYDDQVRKRLELELLVQNGYRSRGGVEYPADGLRVRL
jgi:hypothetical protein